MNKKTFSIRNVVKDSWLILRAQLGKYILLSITLSLASIGLGGAEGQGAVLSILSLLLQAYVGLMWVLIGIRAVEHKKLSLRKTLQEIDLDLFFSYFVQAFLVWIIVIVGLVLLVVPGVIFAIALLFSGYFLVDKKMGIRASLRASWNATKGLRGKIFSLLIVLALINLLGMILLGVGLFVTIPLTVLILSEVYVHTLRERV